MQSSNCLNFWNSDSFFFNEFEMIFVSDLPPNLIIELFTISLSPFWILLKFFIFCFAGIDNTTITFTIKNINNFLTLDILNNQYNYSVKI